MCNLFVAARCRLFSTLSFQFFSNYIFVLFRNELLFFPFFDSFIGFVRFSLFFYFFFRLFFLRCILAFHVFDETQHRFHSLFIPCLGIVEARISFFSFSFNIPFLSFVLQFILFIFFSFFLNIKQKHNHCSLQNPKVQYKNRHQRREYRRHHGSDA